MFNPLYLCELIRISGISSEELAAACGISDSAMHSYLDRGIIPNSVSLVAMADYFVVPLDLVFGRCTEWEAERLLAAFKNRLEIWRKHPEIAYDYDQNLESVILTKRALDLPWPHNLGAAVTMKEDFLSDDQVKGLMYALSQLDDREREVLLAVYRDGATHAELARKLKLSAERIRQIIFRGRRLIKRSSLLKYVLNGYSAATNPTENGEWKLDETCSRTNQNSNQAHVDTL